MTDKYINFLFIRGIRQPSLVLLVLMFSLTTLVYWPGLNGSYLFDDYPNIVINPPVLITTSTVEDWRNAINATRASPYGRQLAMLSFAVNHYLTGLDPFWFKLTNLGLHLLNGLLIFIVLRLLLRLGRQCNAKLATELDEPTAELLATIVAGAWLLAPINLTAVLYVVQRMTGIAQIFVLVGMWAYLHGRRLQLAEKQGWLWIVGGLAGGVVLGLGGKETSILLPAYVLACELALLGFRNQKGGRDILLIGLFSVIILVAVGLALFWMLPSALQGGYDHRSFTLSERLMTQCRVLVSYMQWTLIPDPTSLGFYHDDITVSKGWLRPPSTLLSAGFLVGLLVVGLACLKRAPLIALGIFWFFAAHSLESTFIPLEMVFEHRNYFASLGLLLALLYCVYMLFRRVESRLPVYALLCLLIAWPATVTAMRAQEWSDPLRLASAEAQSHPRSPRAQYELGRTLIVISDYGRKFPVPPEAITALTSAMSLPDSSILPEQALIMLSGNSGKPAEAEWWSSIVRKFKERPPRPDEINSLHTLLLCQIFGPCPDATQEMMQVFVSALGHPNPNETLLANYAEFAAYILEDKVLAMNVAEEAVAVAGRNEPIIRLALGPILRGDISLHKLVGAHDSPPAASSSTHQSAPQ